MKKQSFRYSLLGFIGLMLVFMIFIGSFSVLIIKTVETRYSNMIDKMLSIDDIGSDIDSSVFYFAKYFTTNSEGDKQNYNKYYQLSLNKLKKVDAFANEDLLLYLSDLQNLLYNYHNNAQTAINKLNATGNNEDSHKSFTQTKQIASYCGDYVKKLNNSYLKYNDYEYKILKYKTRTGLIIMVVFLVFTIIFCIIFSIIFSRTITVPIGELASCAKEVAIGKFNIKNQKPSGMNEIDLLQIGFTKMTKEIKQLIEKIRENADIEKELSKQQVKNLQVENMLKETRLKALQAQINPHFLFNTLNTISQTAIIEGADVTEELINAVSDLLRYSLSMIDKQSKIETEISVIKQYMTIQKTRFRDRIKFSINVDETLNSVAVPGMLLQPLVENAFAHGVESLEEGGEISVKVEKQQEYCLICVEDNGCGISEDKLKSLLTEEYVPNDQRTGIGVKNVIRRLRIMYKNDDVITIHSKLNEGTKIFIKIPLDRGDMNA